MSLLRTERELLALVEEAKYELGSIGISIGLVRSVMINAKLHSCWGRCRKGFNGYQIILSAELLRKEVSDTAVKDTIIHELLHTCPGCMKHTGNWKMLANLVNQKYPQYHIKRCTTNEEKGLPAKPRKAPNYAVACTQCNFKTYRQNRSSVVAHPENYRCPNCGGMLRAETITTSEDKED